MKKYQIFVSSTYLDLIEERAQVTKAILEIGHIPVGMEMFSASDETQWKLIQRQIDDCDYYVVVVAHKYGSRDTDGRSYTEKEYDYAVSKGIPVLGFIIENGAPWQPTKMDKDADLVSLNLFKDKVKSKMVKMWSSKEALHAAIVASLSMYFAINPRVGWIKASEGANPENVNEIVRLSSENALLREELERINVINNEDYKNRIDKILTALSKNKKEINIRYQGEDHFRDGPTVMYIDIFKHLAQELLEGQDIKECMDIVAYAFTPKNQAIPAKQFPIAINVMKSILGDFIALDLIDFTIEPQGISYKLSAFGFDVYKRSVLNFFEKQ